MLYVTLKIKVPFVTSSFSIILENCAFNIRWIWIYFGSNSENMGNDNGRQQWEYEKRQWEATVRILETAMGGNSENMGIDNGRQQ